MWVCPECGWENNDVFSSCVDCGTCQDWDGESSDITGSPDYEFSDLDY